MMCSVVLYSAYSEVNQQAIHIHPLFFKTLFPYMSLQSIEEHSCAYTVGPYQSSILYIIPCVHVSSDCFYLWFLVQLVPNSPLL